jgi:hypothetical protein
MVDSALRPKLSYYLVKESFSPLLIKFVRENGHLEIGFKNNGGSQFRGYLEILYIVLPGGKSERIVKKKIIEPAGSSSHSVSITVPEELDKSNALIVASVYDNKNNLKKRSAYCATEWKYLKLPKAKIKIKGAGSKSKNIVRISSDKPAFFVKLHNSNFVFENNGFILLPGEEVETGYTPMSKFKAKSAANISVSCLNDYLHR